MAHKPLSLKSPDLTVISYNLEHHGASSELEDLVAEHNPEILCVQECLVSQLTPTIGTLTLAAESVNGNDGLATYVQQGRFTIQETLRYPIRKSVHDVLFSTKRDRLLVSKLHDREFDMPLVVANFHATHLVATNHLRRAQVREALKLLDRLSASNPAMLTGDYNYPFFIKTLEKLVQEHDFELIKPASRTYKRRFYAGRFDFVSYYGMQQVGASVLPFKGSDHAPIKIMFNFAH